MKILLARIIVAVGFLLGTTIAGAQLSPGFDRSEYADLLWLQFNTLGDSLARQQNFSLEKGAYNRLLLTPEVGLLNRASIFLRYDGVVVIELRGTVPQAQSWLENFYAGMVPATGSLSLSKGQTFSYQLAADTAATIHAGWLLGSAFLLREMLPLLDSLVAAGNKDMLVSGHSQGGALSFVVTSFLHYHYSKMGLSVRLKTYASAAPKPGNLYYAYDFAHITRNQMGFRVVNTEDWVPEVPFTAQTLDDFRSSNPFTNAKGIISKQKFLQRTVMNNVYNKMDNHSRKAAKTFRKQLGTNAGKLVAKALPELEMPPMSNVMNYSSAGTPVVLVPDADYHKQYQFSGQNYFVHHMYAPYMHLLNLWYPK